MACQAFEAVPLQNKYAISTGDTSQLLGGLLTSLRGGELSESVHKREDTGNGRILLRRPGLLERASEEESHSAYPHLISVRLVGSVERPARVWPFRPARNHDNCILRRNTTYK